MDKEKGTWVRRFGDRRRHGLFWGLFLIAGAGFWLLKSLNLTLEPGRVVLPALGLLWGLATLFARQPES